MSPVIKLSQLAPGERGRIDALESGNDMSGRLTDLGFYPGRTAQALFRAPWGDPTAYLIQSSVIALRRSDAEKILITPI